MTRIEVTRAELVWPGKYSEEGALQQIPRVRLPLQVIEGLNEDQAGRQAHNRRPSARSKEEGRKNQLIWGDNLLVMGSLLEKFAGKIDLIYIDPPFARGADFLFTAPIGESGEALEELSIIGEKAYRDTWGSGLDSYLKMMWERLVLMKELLSPNGSMYVHADAHVSPVLRLLMSEVLGREAFRNEIYWYYTNKIPDTRKRLFTKSTDTILFYALGDNFFAHQEEERQVPIRVSRMKKVEGKKVYVRGEDGKVQMIERTTRVVDNVWRIAMLHAQPEITGYPTQKPEPLLERILCASSREGDLVADFFCGSGTTLAVAEKLGRRWIGCDLGRLAIHTTRKRLLSIEGCRPFQVLDLGQGERQYWQGVKFGERGHCQYLSFILQLYGAQPVPGLAHLHGKKGRAMVRVGAVDAPVTMEQIDKAMAECRCLKKRELHVLGWEWEMGLARAMVGEAEKQRVKLLLLQIPRQAMEQRAVDQGDLRFFELAHLEVEIARPGKRRAVVVLKGLAMPNAERIPEEVRQKVRKWSDYIDYWAVDWDFQNEVFTQGWATYRTRKDRGLALRSDAHVYKRPGQYRILVKTVDIFGNETSQVCELEVS